MCIMSIAWEDGKTLTVIKAFRIFRLDKGGWINGKKEYGNEFYKSDGLNAL